MLDREVLEDLHREQGDAEGYDWSGGYLIEEVTPLRCTCPPTVTGGLLDACALTPPDETWLIVTQADGQIQVDPGLFVPAIGPLYADGTFSAGSVSFTNLIVGRIQALWRIDGELEEVEEVTPPDVQNRALLDGIMRVRLSGTTIINPDGDLTTASEEVDCVEEVELRAVRQF